MPWTPLSQAYVPAGAAVPARWTPEALAEVMAALRRGAAALAEIPDSDLLDAWAGTVEDFLDPASPERRSLDPDLARLCRLSPEGLAAGLEAVLGGVRRGPAAALLAEARGLGLRCDPSPVFVALASNLPALAVQPLLPALALRRPVLLKSPSAEPRFAPAFLAALARREPRLAGALAAAAWPGGDRELEAPVLAAAGRVVAYGELEALNDLERRAPGRVVGYGPKTSLAVVGAEVGGGAALEEMTRGLARDIALFDQRGCLSIAAVWTAGDARALAERLAEELGELARRWPPGPAGVVELSGVQSMRLEAEMREVFQEQLEPLAAGTVIVDPAPAFRPSPGLRAVRVHPLPDLGRLPAILAPWRGRLQGAALAGADAEALAPRLAELGVSRFAAPGELQSPDALWHNGGIHPLGALA